MTEIENKKRNERG